MKDKTDAGLLREAYNCLREVCRREICDVIHGPDHNKLGRLNAAGEIVKDLYEEEPDDA